VAELDPHRGEENVAEEILRLKEQPGKDISISGSPTLVRSLLEEDLIDELRLMVHPIVVVGSGKRLFEEGGDQKALELVDSKIFSTGVLYASPTSRRRAESNRGLGHLILASLLPLFTEVRGRGVLKNWRRALGGGILLVVEWVNPL
jgi:hypothetical protein